MLSQYLRFSVSLPFFPACWGNSSTSSKSFFGGLIGRVPLSLRTEILDCLGSDNGVGDSLRLAVMADVVGVVVSAFRFTPFFLMTGGAGGTTGIGGGATTGGIGVGTGTGVTFAGRFGTGVAAITGVCVITGGTVWAGAGRDTEDTAVCCAPLALNRCLRCSATVSVRLPMVRSGRVGFEGGFGGGAFSTGGAGTGSGTGGAGGVTTPTAAVFATGPAAAVAFAAGSFLDLPFGIGGSNSTSS